jgi:hypothetical protein
VRSLTSIALAIIAGLFAPTASAQTAEPREPAALDAPADDAAEVEESQPAAAPWRWPGTIIWDLELRLVFPPETGFDRSLAAHGYGTFRIIPALVAGIAAPVGVEWLWVGGQVGVRGRTWDHAARESASLVGVDLLATVRARFLVGQRVELGAVVGGGLGWIGTWVNGLMSDQLAPRFNAQLDLAFRIGDHFALGPSGGWDYFQMPSAINAYGDGVDAGGFYFGLSVEGRE